MNAALAEVFANISHFSQILINFLYFSLFYLLSKKHFMAPFYGWGSTVSKLQRHHKETVYFLPLSSQRPCYWLSGPWSHPVVLNLEPLD